jgi:hypothetical protein
MRTTSFARLPTLLTLLDLGGISIMLNALIDVWRHTEVTK